MNKTALLILLFALVGGSAIVIPVVTLKREKTANNAAIEKLHTDTGEYIDELSETIRRNDAGLPPLPKLVKCRACSLQISDQAKACPNCGHNSDRPN